MFLKRMRLTNFGAFRDTDWLTFTRGVNLIVGQNNSGKSSLINSLERNLRDTPHVSLDAYRPENLERPVQEVELQMSGEEVRNSLLRRGGSIFWPLLELPADMSDRAINRAVFDVDQYLMKFERSPGAMRRIPGLPTHSAFQRQPAAYIELSALPPKVRVGGHGHGETDTIIELLQFVWDSVFIFNAERTSVSQCSQSEQERIAPRAENLPAFLHLMQGRRPAQFALLVEHVRSILPTVHSLTTTSVGNSETRILIWPTDCMDREEFSFPLAESGTGVGQVIAIVAAAMSSDPTVFVVDEINSYIHPTAVKSLLRLLQNVYGHHQYIISTHSPEVISHGDVGSVFLVKRDGMESTIQSVDMSDVSQLREMADHIGISVSDVFAADHVLWVEGRTEELCFSLLMQKMNIPFPANTIVSAVVSTGDFFGRRRDIDLVFQVYERLARVSLPLVKSVAFSFDREDLTQREMDDTRRRADGRVAFLPRRHFECYLIDPGAISALANDSDLERKDVYTRDAVESLLQDKAGERKYLAGHKWKGDLADQEWLAEVDAANLISDVLGELTSHRVHFSKVDHSPRLIDEIVRTDPSSLEELVVYVRRLGELLDKNDG